MRSHYRFRASPSAARGEAGFGRTRWPVLGSCVGASICMVLSSFPLRAQDTAARTDPGATSGVLEQIVVTAQRRSENLQRVPISVAVVQADDIQNSGVATAADLDQLVAGMKQVHKAAAQGGTPYIRGIGFGSSTPGIESPVATYIDDVYIGDAVASSPSFNSVERIEVLKGPQGTLFGRNAVAGVVHIHTKDPTFEPAANVELGYGNYDTTSAKFYGTSGLGDNVAVNLAASYAEQSDGYGFNYTLNEDFRKYKDLALRAKLLAELGEQTSLLLTGWYSNTEGDATSYRLYPGRVGRLGYIFPYGFYDGVSSPQPSENEASGASLRFEHDFGAVRLVNVTANYTVEPFFTNDQDQTPPPFALSRPSWKTDMLTNELQLLSAEDAKVQWLVGFFYLTQDIDEIATLTGTSNPAGQVIDSTLETDSWAPFGQATFEILPDTRLTAGVRYNSDERHLVSSLSTTAGALIVASDRKKDWSKVTYRLSLDHQFTPDVLGYVSYNRGYKPGTYNPGANPTRPEIEPELLDAYELGIKSQLLEGRLQLNPSVFYYDYTDITVRGLLPGGIATDFFNGDGAEIYGLDLDFRALITDRLTVSGGVSWLHSEYTDFPNAQSYIPQPLPTGGNVPITPFDATGNELSNAPDVSGNVRFDYDVLSNPAFGDVTMTGNFSYYTRFYFEADNRLGQGAYGILNSAVSWRSAGEHYGVTLWANNLLDKRYLGEAAGLTTGDIVSPGAPRTYGIRFWMGFGP